jgi:hypothetical protein
LLIAWLIACRTRLSLNASIFGVEADIARIDLGDLQEVILQRRILA